MKKILILIYVLVVVSLSISARAEVKIPLLVDSVIYNAQAQSLEVTGQYPNPCVSNPTPQLVKTSKGQLILTLKGESDADICIQIVGPKYILSVDLYVLKSQISEMGLDADAIHSIYDLNQKLVAEVDFSDVIKRIDFETTEISGVLVSEDQALYVHGDHGARVQVRSHLNELDSLHNVEVTLTGHMMTHSVSNPIFNTNLATPQFIATGVSFSIAD